MHISKEIAHYFAAVLFLFRQKLPSRLLPNIFRRLDSSFIAFFFSATASFTSTVSNIWPPATGTSLPISFWISFRYGTSSTSQKEKAIPLRPILRTPFIRTSLYYCSSLFFLFCITNYYTLLRPSLHES